MEKKNTKFTSDFEISFSELQLSAEFKPSSISNIAYQPQIFLYVDTSAINIFVCSEDFNKIQLKFNQCEKYQNILFFNNFFEEKKDIFIERNQHLEKYSIENDKSYLILKSNWICELPIKNDNCRKLIFFTDLDSTLINVFYKEEYDCDIGVSKESDDLLEEFTLSWLKTVGFETNVHLIYTTGRIFETFTKIRLNVPFLKPKYVVCGNGTLIYELDTFSSRYILDLEWEKVIMNGWDSQTVEEVFQEVFFELIKDGFFRKNTQSPSDKYGVRFLCDQAIYTQNLALFNKAKQILLDKNINFRIFVCGNSEEKYVDIHPENSGKEKANQYLMKKLDIEPNKCFCFGDSENDWDMLVNCENSILVNNAVPKLVEKVLTERTHIIYSQKKYAGALTSLLNFILE